MIAMREYEVVAANRKYIIQAASMRTARTLMALMLSIPDDINIKVEYRQTGRKNK